MSYIYIDNVKKMELKEISQLDGTSSGFSENNLENGVLYFIRTNAEKTEGYIYLNGKRYGEMPKVIDCGTYHGTQEENEELNEEP